FIDNDHYFTVLDDSIQSLYMANPDTFSVLGTLNILTIRHVLDQIKVITADHSFFADYNERVLTFFNMYSDVLSTAKDTSISHQYTLYPAYPNPFNPTTTLRYDLPEQAYVNIIIYDLLGRQVKTLINQTQDAGFKSVIWNATNDYGKPVSAGVYLYNIQAGEFVQTKKMVLLK
ncbi:MAG: T9SS type A sorting domain-containing protein, partial [Candidatus Marinimicrobia bacterium]|nr:T9SS type A sorting domain-containing protein [Candidatus Neomarinimicrobiota bacterium]